MTLRTKIRIRLLIVSLVSTILGYLIIFVQSTFYPGLLVPLGLFLAIGGMILLLYTFIKFLDAVYSTESYQRKAAKTYNIYREALKLAITGGVVYVLMGIVASLIIPVPQELRSSVVPPTVLNLTGLLLGGILIAFFVSYYYILYFDRISIRNPILKSEIFSLLGLLILGGLETFLHSSGVTYFLYSVAFNTPRFLLVGVVIGYVYEKFHIVSNVSPTTSIDEN